MARLNEGGLGLPKPVAPRTPTAISTGVVGTGEARALTQLPVVSTPPMPMVTPTATNTQLMGTTPYGGYQQPAQQQTQQQAAVQPYRYYGFGGTENLQGAGGILYSHMLDYSLSQGYLPGQITYPELNVNISNTAAQTLAAAGYQEIAPYGYFLPGSSIGNLMGVQATPGGGGGGGGGSGGGVGGGGGSSGGGRGYGLINWRIGF